MVVDKKCIRCGETKPRTEFHKSSQTKTGLHVYCKPCIGGMQRDWYLRNRESELAKQKKYRDAHKEEHSAYSKEYWAKPENRTRLREQTRARKRRAREEVFAAYGGKCTCCGESRLSFLSIDHVGGGGNAHRREIGSNGGECFYRWLKKNGYPQDGYQVLCFNCNCATGFFGRCPHNDTEQQLAGIADAALY